MATLDIGSIKHDYDRDGFVIIRDYLRDPELSELRERAVGLTDRVMPRAQDQRTFKNLMKNLNVHDSWFEEQLVRGEHVPLIETLLEDEIVPASAAWFDRPSGATEGIAPHVDAVGRGREQNTGCTIWIALDAADAENGCLYYGRGSHKVEFPAKIPIPGFATTGDDVVAAEVRPGDAVVHNALTVHWSGENRTERPRRAVSYFYWGAAANASLISKKKSMKSVG